MKILALLFLLASSTAESRTNLFRRPAEELPSPVITAPLPAKSLNQLPVRESLPEQVRTVNADAGRSRRMPAPTVRSWAMVTTGNPVVSPSKAQRFLADLLPGILVRASVPMSVMAFSDGKAPVLAQFRSKENRDYLVLGEATLERASKRITVEFNRIREQGKSEVYSFKAAALAEDGSLGLEGEVHSGAAKFFIAELASAAAAGFADSTINRSTGAFGNNVEQPSLDTHTKKAVSSALLRSAERFGENQKTVSEYSVLEGPVSIQVLIQEQPKLSFEGGK